MIFATPPGTVGSAGVVGTAGAGARAAPPVDDPVGVGLGVGETGGDPFAPPFEAIAAGAPPSTAHAHAATVEAMVVVTRKSFSFVGLRG
jgi:hypothetical protein